MPDNRTGYGQVAPWYLWAVGILAVLWNGVGTMLWGGTNFMPEFILGARFSGVGE